MLTEIRSELRKPATVIAYIITVISIVVSVSTSYYFYQRGQRAGLISTSVEQIQIFDRQRIGTLPLKLIGADSSPITNNVFVANVTIWNAGNAEIRREDVRKPLRLLIASGIKPLDMVATFPDDNLGKISINQEGIIDWEHFDPGSGLKVRALYESAEMLPIELAGTIAGIGDVSVYAKDEITISKTSKVLSLILGALTGVFSSLTFMLILESRKGQSLRDRRRVALVGTISMLLLVLGISIYWFLSSRLTGPPF